MISDDSNSYSFLYVTFVVSQIEKVFLAACHKKAWDHFTKAQRKNIDMWKKQAAVSVYDVMSLIFKLLLFICTRIEMGNEFLSNVK